MTRTQSWSASLMDSVYALGAAARECQSAYQAAVIAKRHADLDRIRLIDGKVTRRTPGYTSEQEPHLAALSHVGDVLLKTEFKMKALYEEAARAYAHGANWAVRQVQHEVRPRPAYVELEVAPNGHYLFPSWVPALDLDRYTDAAAVESARKAYEQCLTAIADAAAIDSQAYIADHEAGQFHRALDIAAGLPDAAYAYGVLAESALRFVLSTQSTRE
ncbi:hypothetical protein [Streptomyces sp. NPDC087437]|uniref:hypothetical protein n=1 Tax=Streptomyces sp. NPDC087437 TaxID=3365789 RepID=UPI00380DD8B4